MSGASAESRIGALDTLRGVAILAVVASHFLPHLPIRPFDYEAVGLGRGGVILFFLLSGYLIFRNIRRQPIPVFVCRRLFKIMPAYWVNVAAILALDTAFTGAPHFAPASYAASFLMVSDLLRIDAVSGVYWTLLIEAKFYLFIAVQYALLRDRGVFAVFLGLVALNGLAWAMRGQGSLLLTFFPTFYVGIAIQRAEAAGWSRRSLAVLAGAVAVLGAGMAVTLDEYGGWSAVYLVLGVLLFVGALRAGMSNRVLGWFGRISYSGYLYHPMVGAAVFGALGATASLAAGLSAVMAASVLSVIAAAILYRVVEAPSVGLGRRFETAVGRMLSRGKPAPQAA